MCHSFSDAVIQKISNYVYRLIDPRNGETFYVGKGRGNRVFSHIRDELILGEDEDTLTTKLQRIRDIRNANLEVIHIIHRHEIPDHAVDEVEAALIDAFPGLANEIGGFGSSARGPMHSQEINAKYDLPELEREPKERLVLINIPRLEDRASRQAIYDQTRFAWKIRVQRAQQADYVLAVFRGVVVGAFANITWLEATRDNFAELDRAVTLRGKWGFQADFADEQSWERFVGQDGKRITNPAMKHVQFPVRYWNIP